MGGARRRRTTRRWLVRLLAGLGAVTLVITSALVLVVLPAASRASGEAITTR